ncbi:hypothetical protein Tco_1579181, partial [Tanacetum coccineum]
DDYIQQLRSFDADIAAKQIATEDVGEIPSGTDMKWFMAANVSFKLL